MKNAITIVLILFNVATYAQQDPIYAQYLNNPLVINPAYAGSNNMFNANLQYRTQWAGVDANPTTTNFNTHMSVLQNKVGVGLMVIQDKLGDNKTTAFNAVYAYKIKLNNSYFSFGMQSGVTWYTNDPSLLTIRDAGDPKFGSISETKFNIGAGLLLKSDKFIVGLSVPKLVPVTIRQGGQTITLQQQHYYLFGSYAIFLSENVRFKPSVLLRGTSNAPISVDLNASLNIKELYTVGVFTRNLSSYGLLTQAVFGNFRLGYIIEIPGSQSASLNFVSHEMFVGISTAILNSHDKGVKTF